MNLQSVIAPVSRLAGKSLLKARKYAPEVMLAAGIGCVIAGTVKACQETSKAEEVLEAFNKKKAEVKEIKESEEFEAEREELGYNDAAYRKEIAGLYFDTGIKLLKVYWKPLVLGVSGIALIFGSHGILRRRISGLTAAYTAIDTAYRNYRQRVINELGEEKDREFRTGIKKIADAAVATIDPETGETKIDKAEINAIDLNDPSDYGRYFGEGTTSQWDKSPEYNIAFLKAQETYFNNLLHTKGHVFLNEVYFALGFPETSAGAVVGWVDNGSGDNYIDFGITGNLYNESDDHNSKKTVYVSKNGYYLDFNVDGVIWDKI